jgi:pimeloyl-ACP methyl ester carboxylesterase
VFFVLFVWSRIGAYRIARDNPPVGAFLEVNETRMHYVHVPARAGAADLPPLVFIHGASANLNDQMVPFRRLLEGRAELLFLDRPGHGWSERGPDNSNQSLQADTIVALMDALKIKDAIIVAHSFGGSVATPLVLKYPERVRGLLFLAAASHPWPNKKTQWYYDVAVMPVLGRIFTETIALPAGSLRIEAGSEHVFCPNKMPNNYLEKAQIPLVLRPSAFRNNAVDVAGLHDFVSMISPRYGEIDKPAIVITGDQDTVVLEEVHSRGLARDIKNSELVWIRGLGHKPDYIATSLAVAAIEKLNGADRDLQAAARNLEDAIPKMEPGTCG